MLIKSNIFISLISWAQDAPSVQKETPKEPAEDQIHTPFILKLKIINKLKKGEQKTQQSYSMTGGIRANPIFSWVASWNKT